MDNTPFEPGEDRLPTSPWHCDHAACATVARKIADGRMQAWLQCTRCGAGIRSVKTSSPLDSLSPWSESLRAEWSERGRQEMRRRDEERARAREAEGAEWWAAYDAYRQTARWRLLRGRVIERAKGRCEAFMEGCTTVATQAHHLTYDHWGDEPIFDLVAVCASCHDRITARDRANRAQRS